MAPGGASAACAARPFPERLSLRRRFATAKAADAVELDQSKVRFVLNIAAAFYLLAGYTGQVNFGHALFFGAGAYASGLLSLKLGISPWATVWAGAAVAMLFGFLVGYLCLRLRGSYLSLATLAFPLIALGLLFAFPDFSGGELGISGLRRLMTTPTGNYYVAAISMLVIVFGLWLLADSRIAAMMRDSSVTSKRARYATCLAGDVEPRDR